MKNLLKYSNWFCSSLYKFYKEKTKEEDEMLIEAEKTSSI